MVFHRILDFKTRLDFYPASIFWLVLNLYNITTFIIAPVFPFLFDVDGSTLMLTFAA